MGQRRTKGRREISRRQFLRLSAVAAVGTGLAACGGEAPAPVAETEPSPPAGQAETPASPVAEASPAEQATATPVTVPTEFNEAPMIAEMGDLPAVAERLPSNPCVCPVMESIGKYGGTIRRGFSGVSDRVGPTKMNNEGLTWYNPDLSLRANIADSWEVNDDATEWTFHLREGMKWSDGHPFDSESFMWWYDNEIRNETITPVVPSAWVTGTEERPMVMEAPDPVTVIFRFEHPYPLFAYTVARNLPFTPGHYLQQFHADLAEDPTVVKQEAEAAGFEDWSQWYVDRNTWYLNPERPDTGPWHAQNPLSEELFIMERNPYFWQVDAEGNQLPYVDRVHHRLFNTPEVLNLRVVNGEIDFQARHMSIGNFTLYKENEANGDYRVMLGVWANHQAFQPNHTTTNERLREFFQNRDVRIALSHAINRPEINELVLLGQATPRQYSPLSLSPQFYEPLSEAYIEYNPDRANELLDQAGYTEKNSQGFRLWKDGSGEVLNFIIEGTAEAGTPDEDAVQTMVRYFADVGVRATYSAVERSLYEEHYAANNIESAFWGGDRTTLPLVAPGIFLGTIVDRPWACAWGLWYNDPTDPNGTEPPQDHWIREIWSIWDQIAVEPDEERQTELFHQILDIWAEELPMIGLLGEIPAPVIVKNGLHNYVEGYPIDDTTEDEQLLNPQTLFWEDPESHA